MRQADQYTQRGVENSAACDVRYIERSSIHEPSTKALRGPHGQAREIRSVDWLTLRLHVNRREARNRSRPGVDPPPTWRPERGEPLGDMLHPPAACHSPFIRGACVRMLLGLLISFWMCLLLVLDGLDLVAGCRSEERRAQEGW